MVLFSFLIILWQILALVQSILGYGTAYRLTKKGGDNGVALFGWMIVMQLAAVVPGLGIWLWLRHRYDDRAVMPENYDPHARTNSPYSPDPANHSQIPPHDNRNDGFKGY